MKLLIIVQVRGVINVSKKIKDTLRMLNLSRKNSCVLVSVTGVTKGMLLKVKDYVTWGEIDAETLNLLLEKRGRLPGGKFLSEKYVKEKLNMSLNGFALNLINGEMKVKDLPGLKKFFRLHPPVGGFEKGGIKKGFSLGGTLGYRGKKINDLIRRMV